MAKHPVERSRDVPVNMTAEEFRSVGHRVVDDLADLFDGLSERRVTPHETPTVVRRALGVEALPEAGTDATELVRDLVPRLADHSLFNGNPRFWGYITSSPTPIGAIGDLVAAGLNPNVGAWGLAPIATEIEAQTVRWIAELVGYPTDCGGVLGSGGNVANMIGLLAARRAKAPWDVRKEGLQTGRGRLLVYASGETHTWLHKAADLFGLGLDAIRWIPADGAQRMRVDLLEGVLAEDREAGFVPFAVVGAAGTVGTGAVDPLGRIAEVCRRNDLWFHVDGAYGAFAAALPEASDDLKALNQADSVALDPHKWLYAPLEVGCTLVRDRQHMIDAFSFHPEYYRFDGGEEPGTNFFEFGLQNSRGFRALKVWLALRQAGRAGVTQMIRDDIELSKAMFEAIRQRPELEAVGQSLSIATFRYVPEGASPIDDRDHLNALNTELLSRLQDGGEAYVSNAVVDGNFLLRACIVNFRTTLEDVRALPDIVVRLGRQVEAEMRRYP